MSAYVLHFFVHINRSWGGAGLFELNRVDIVIERSSAVAVVSVVAFRSHNGDKLYCV